MPSRISVITPTRNMGHFLEPCILSNMAQFYPDLEHIVVDGASTDNSVEILRRYPHLRWVSEPDKGLSDGLNKGIRMATGDIIGWCNADDLYLPGTLIVVNESFTAITAKRTSLADLSASSGRCISLRLSFAG